MGGVRDGRVKVILFSKLFDHADEIRSIVLGVKDFNNSIPRV
jgi:hypothetical protein